MSKMYLGHKLHLLAAFSCIAAVSLARAVETNGFAVKFTTGDNRNTDVTVLPNLWLHVEEGKPATPFLPAGRFTAVFEGSINADLRSDYLFKAEELNGAVKLEINSVVVLDTSRASDSTKPVQLSKGANSLRATFTSPARGDSALRIGWMEKGTNSVPIPDGWITHESTPELEKAAAVYRGRELFLDHRCAKCHGAKFAAPIPELGMDAPELEGLGARRRFDWLAKWILDPKLARASVHMPKLLHGTEAKKDAEAVAAFLMTLKTALSLPSQLRKRNPRSSASIAPTATTRPTKQTMTRRRFL